MRRWDTKKVLKILVVNLAVLSALLCLVELFFYVLIRHPGALKHMPMPLVDAATALYRLQDQKLVHTLPDCVRYDPGLTYTLRPGECVFANREFENRFLINSLGLRDDEESLHDPEIMVIGDSFAMGWGVDQQEAFPQRLESLISRKVLNAGVSSYGTVREMKQVARVGSGNLKTLIIQYCFNDFNENNQFYLRGNAFVPVSRQKFELFSAIKRQINTYRFGKYLYLFAATTWHKLKQGKKEPDPDIAAERFLNVLHAHEGVIRDARIIVFELSDQDRYSGFIPALRNRLASMDSKPAYIRNMKVMDFSGLLDREDFFLLDGHLNREGHEKVAQVLARVLGEGGSEAFGPEMP